MRKALLPRTEISEDGTFGRILTDSGFTCFTVENTNLRIPPGVYICVWAPSPAHGHCYHLQDVPGRSFIEIHAANWADELLGCISPGTSMGPIDGKRGVRSSQSALKALEDDLGRETFELTVEDPVEVD